MTESIFKVQNIKTPYSFHDIWRLLGFDQRWNQSFSYSLKLERLFSKVLKRFPATGRIYNGFMPNSDKEHHAI